MHLGTMRTGKGRSPTIGEVARLAGVSPTTVSFVLNDVAGSSIPEVVATVGFDNQELIAAHLRPSLSTVALPHYEMGRWAVGHLIEQAREDDHDPACHRLPLRRARIGLSR